MDAKKILSYIAKETISLNTRLTNITSIWSKISQ